MSDTASELIRITNGIGRGVIPPLQHHECFTAGAFDLLLVKAHGTEAFALLNALCGRYPEVDPQPSARAAYFRLLADGARQTRTTEIPAQLPAVLAKHPEDGAELRAWYRLVA